MKTPRKTTKKTSRLKWSKLENLFSHANGVYWVRAKVNGKSVERSLRTGDYDHAAKRLGIDHLRVHDLRHIFGTRCIKSGVDLPTL